MATARTLYQESATLSLWAITIRNRERRFSRIERRLHELALALQRAKEKGGLKFGDPCQCRRNHHSILVDGLEMCPVLFVLWCNVLAKRENPYAVELLSKVGLGNVLKPIEEGVDMTYAQELEAWYEDRQQDLG